MVADRGDWWRKLAARAQLGTSWVDREICWTVIAAGFHRWHAGGAYVQLHPEEEQRQRHWSKLCRKFDKNSSLFELKLLHGVQMSESVHATDNLNKAPSSWRCSEPHRPEQPVGRRDQAGWPGIVGARGAWEAPDFNSTRLETVEWFELGCLWSMWRRNSVLRIRDFKPSEVSFRGSTGFHSFWCC